MNSGLAPLSVSGYVLAGGRSSRMGKDKALLEVGGEPLVEHALRRLRPVCERVRILSGPPDFERDAFLSCYEHLVSDEEGRYAGPLAAVAAALRDCPTDYALLLGVDQPDMSTETLKFLARLGSTHSSSAACFTQDGKPEPLPLLIRRELRDGIAEALQAGERRLLPTVQACIAAAGGKLTLLAAPEATDLFTNLNTPGDLRRWQAANRSNHSDAGASELHDGR